MTPEARMAVFDALQRVAQVQYAWDVMNAAATIDVSISTEDFIPMEGRPLDQALLQVVSKIKTLAKEFDEIGV